MVYRLSDDKKYIAESKIVKDTILYARWESSDTVDYIVKYVSSIDGSDIALEENRNAELGSTVSEVANQLIIIILRLQY